MGCSGNRAVNLRAGSVRAWPGRLRGSPQHNSEDTFVVLASHVRSRRLRLAHERRLVNTRFNKRVETAVEVDVIGHDRATGRERTPSVLQFEEKVALGVPAVVDEEVDRFDLRYKTRQPSSARTMDVGPVVTKMLGDGDGDLLTDIPMTERRKVDAPQMSRSVRRESFEDEACGHASRNTCLDNGIRPEMQGEAMDRAYQRGLSVAPAGEGTASERDPIGVDRFDDRSPECREAITCRAWPGGVGQLDARVAPSRRRRRTGRAAMA